ncbi:acyl-CoA/acyl-ACP dehydrogenase [Pseudomaricurvus alkylphenolicus]|uniref:acyl-CoA dehydrogenase family protein n=1 Tax=Pseudomaricurvus alkylphenolicus TaxID=1306991 RepID=UPI001422C840|nr:acyl-CoA dehydrogenase family protein [Pseudomaricurvus alkylphenolicus]NIB38932.1 acyl-CoA/acyl-ACP dehydrogenase [Pseudomaricurvus alkylphenolicus]
MDLNYSQDQIALSDLVRNICHDFCDTTVVRSCEDDALGYAKALWDQLSQSGLLGIAIDETHGGSKLPMLESAAIYEQFGYALAPVPHFVSSVVSALIIDGGDNTQLQNQLLPGVAAGDIILTPASLEPEGDYEPEGIQTSATMTSSGYVLKGVKRHVFYASSADYLLVLARTGENKKDIDIFLVPRDAKGVQLIQEHSMASDCQYRIELNNVIVDTNSRINAEGDGWRLWSHVLNEAIILDAASAVGLAERALEITVGYAKEREQFDKPIGAFQAIGHYLADCATAVEGARALVYEAAWAHASEKPYAALASMAKLFACNTARDVTAKAEQIHGGIGFTMEYDIQLFFRRAKQQQLNWWDSRYLEKQVAAAVLDSDQPLAVADPFTIEVESKRS